MVYFIIILLIGLVPVKSANILVLLIFGSNSHRIQFEPLFQGLANRGHNLTIISHTRYPKYPNITEINCSKVSTMGPTMTEVLEKRIKGESFRELHQLFFKMFISYCDVCIKDSRVIDLMQNGKFDLIFQDAAGSECGFGILQHFNAPYIFIHPIPPMPSYRPLYGLPLQPSIYPMPFTKRTYEMTYMERIVNFCENIISELGLKYYYFNKIEEYYRNHLPNSASAEEIFANTSLIFTSEHPTFDLPKLSLPHIIETGGLHCREPKSLPQDLDQFINGSESHGFIFFSMGSLHSSSSFPKDLINTFVKVFSRLKQNVLWKHDAPIENLPPNIKTLKWIPQQDILGHQNIRLFITQGGLASMQEAVCHGVPVIGIPITTDQDEVIAKAERHGSGIMIDIKDLDEDLLYTSIQKILNEPRFAENAKILSQKFKDRPLSPLDTAIYWSEYVIRYNGASFLKPKWTSFSVFKYHGVDVICPLIITFSLLVYIMFSICIFIFRRLMKTKSKYE